MPTFMIRRFFKKLFLPPMVIIAAAIMFIEEWLWDHLAAAMAWVARAPFFRWLEAKLAALHPYAAMVVFLVPGAMLLPVKIGALYLMTHGHAGLGLLLILTAKFIGTAIAARLFTVCRPALLTVRWFRWIYEGILRLKTRLYTAIKAMPRMGHRSPLEKSHQSPPVPKWPLRPAVEGGRTALAQAVFQKTPIVNRNKIRAAWLDAATGTFAR